MLFSVIIPTLGRPGILRRTLESIARADPPPYEVVVVDGDADASARDVTVVVEQQQSFAIRYRQSEPGSSRQRNVGMEIATGDVFVFFDDDVVVDPGVFGVLSREYADESIVGVTGRVFESEGARLGKKHSRLRRLLPGGGRDGSFTRYGFPRRLTELDVHRDIEFMHGSFMSARAEVARSVRFDEGLPGYGLAEDEDFSYRTSLRGRILYTPDASLWHARTGHSRRDARAFGKKVVVNRAYLFRKNFPTSLVARLQFALLIVFLLIHRAINAEWRECAGLLEGARAVLRGEHLVHGGAGGPVKVTFLSSHSKLGGSESYLATLLRCLGEDWIDRVVLLEEGPLVSQIRSSGSGCSVLPTSGRTWSIVLTALRLRRAWGLERPSVVHANGVKAALVGALASIGTRSRLVWVKHDFSWDGPLSTLIAGRCDAIVGVSEVVLEALPPGARARSRVVSSGMEPTSVDRAEARANLISATGFPQGASIVGLVGRLHPIKGQLDLVEITPELVERDPSARVVFIGADDRDAPCSEALRARASALGVADRIALLGHREDALHLMAGFDVGVVATGRGPRGGGREGFGLVSLEFLAVGTAVVAYADGASPEVLGDCARLVPPGDLGALSTAITDLLRDPDERSRLATSGKKRALTEYRLDRMVREMKQIYVGVLK